MSSAGPFVRDRVIPAGMSVSEAARRLGIGRPALSNLLNGNARLSRDLALKLERTFGADANLLIRKQAEIDERNREDEAARVSRRDGGGYLAITSTDIDRWADTVAARTRLPVLLRRLAHADATADATFDFPGNDAGERKGWDGVTEVSARGHWLPTGRTGWELSVSADLPGKPNRDFQARSKLPRAERVDTTFVFVTARSWPQAKDWAEGQRSLGAFRDVRAYEASDLEQWLERSPVTQVWFMGELGRPVDGLRPIGACWRDWAQSTSPPLSPVLFEEAMDAHRQTLHGWIAGDSEHPLVVVADSAAEALAFVARALRDDGDGRTDHYARAVLATTPEALLRLSAATRDAILVIADRETELAAGSVTRRNKIIVVRPRTSVENNPDIALASPSAEAFRRALEDMGVEEERRSRLAEESGLSPTILRRRLALTPELRIPDWARDKVLLRKLMPMLLAGAWSRAVEADRILVAELASRPFEEVEADLVDLLAVADAPVWAIGNYRGVVSRKDALFAAGAALTQAEVDRFFEVAELVLSEDDPALDLPPEDRWTANIYDKKREISGAMRNAVGELLVLLAVYGGRLLGARVAPVGARVSALVTRLLRDVGTRRWLSQQYDLPLLAEAAPRAFLDAVEADLRSDDPQLLAMLRPAGSGPFDSPDRSGLLWALETIAWDEDHLLRVGRVLARLSEVPIADNWVNKPQNSLESLVRSWLPQTAAPIDRRLKLLDVVAREFPAVGWEVCKAQIDTGHRFATPNERPRWRTDAAGAGAGGATYDEDYRTRRRALDLMLGWEDLDMGRLGDLIELSGELPPEDQARVWARAREWIDAGPREDERASLRERMRRSVLTRRGRGKARPGRVERQRRLVFDALAPAEPVERHRWLFAEQWVSESGDELFDDDFDYERHQTHVEGLRREAMAEIVATEGLDGVGRLLSSVNAWGTVGSFLRGATDPGERDALVLSLIARAAGTGGRQWIGCLQGALQGEADEDRGAILRRLAPTLPPEAALVLFRSAFFEARTWDALAATRPELEVSYWRTVQPYGARQPEGELNLCVERLLDVDRPISAFNAMSFELKRLDGAVLGRLMRALTRRNAETETDLQVNAGRISDALDALEASGAATTGELAQLEYFFANALSHSRHGIRNLERQVEESPADFVHLVSLLYRRDDGGEDSTELALPEGVDRQAVGQNVYRVLDRLRRTPGTGEDGVVDASALLAWLVDVRERLRSVGRAEVGDEQIGQLLGRTAAGADGVWPNEAVRAVLEACGNDRMIRGMEIGLYNSRGVVMRGAGGGQERDLAHRYRAFGRQLQADFPVTSRMLMHVADNYESQAAWHDTDEAVRKRLQRR